MRTRTSPKWRVRQCAWPVCPACVVRSTAFQSTVPNGRSAIFIAQYLPASTSANTFVSTLPPLTVSADALAGQRLAFTPGGRERRGAGALGDIVRHGEDRAHGARELRVGDFDDAAHVRENDRERVDIRLAAGHAVGQQRSPPALRPRASRRRISKTSEHAPTPRRRSACAASRHCAPPRPRRCRSPGRSARTPRPDPARRETTRPNSS